MSQLDINTQLIAQIIQALNDIDQNAKKTDEFPAQSPLESTSLIRIEDITGISKKISINDILTQASFQLSNKMLYFNGVTMVGNTVTLLTGTVWRINGIVYSNISNVPFTVPYVVSPGDVRNDLIIGGNSNTDVTKIVGSDGSNPIEPNYPNDKVILCSLLVTNSGISIIGLDDKSSLLFTAPITGTNQTFEMPAGFVPRLVFKSNGFIRYAADWNYSGTTLTIITNANTGNKIDVIS